MSEQGQNGSGAPVFDADRNIISIGDRRLVFHCHHYNIFLQRTIQDALESDGIKVQIAAAAEAAREMLSAAWKNDSPEARADLNARLSFAKEMFRSLGFGLTDLATLGREGGRVKLLTSHYAVGWRAKFGATQQPVCHYAVGFWIGALCAATGLSPERVRGKECDCAAMGATSCELEIEVL